MPRASRKIKSSAVLAKLWEEYKAYCDSYTKQEMVESTYTTPDGTTTTKSVKEILSPISYTKVGFLAYIGISRQGFAETYEKDPAYLDIVEKIRTECEVDVRAKFETGQINSRLAPLWMSKYGYGSKSDASVEHRADNNLLDMIQKSQIDLGEVPEDEDDDL